MLRIQQIKKVEMITKTFRLPLELVEDMQTIAQNKGISLNKLIQIFCEYSMKNLDKE